MTLAYPDDADYSGGKPDRSPGYDVAQVCRHGHLGTVFGESMPERLQQYCPLCGAEMLTACEHCRALIRGFYHNSPYLSAVPKQPPAFCHACGRPLPWTEERLDAAAAYAAELEEVGTEDRVLLAAALRDLAMDSPRTELAVSRVKRIIKKVPQAVGSIIYKVAIEVASDMAKKSLAD